MPGGTRALEALALLLLVAWCMAMSQLNSDSLPPLWDLGYAVIPALTGVVWTNSSYYRSLADIFLVVSIAVFFLLILPFAVKRPWITLVRFMWCLAALFAMRTLTLLSTVYPLTPLPDARYVAPSIPLGAILILFGLRATTSDLMFSGHTVFWVLMATFFWQYRKRGLEYTALALLYWAMSITGIVLLIGCRVHFTSDCVVATLLSLLVAMLYYIVATPQRRDSCLTGVIDWCER